MVSIKWQKECFSLLEGFSEWNSVEESGHGSVNETLYVKARSLDLIQ